MRLESVKEIVRDLPWMSLTQARRIDDHATKFGLSRILELGFMHGVSTCYLAAIAKRMHGSVTTCDLPASANLRPTAEELLERCGLRDLVEIHREAVGAEWRMMKLLEQREVFDFIYIDSEHTWQCTGFHFFLAEKLLRVGGWILFDDLDYVLTEQPHADQPWALRMTREQRETAQVRLVWEMLAKQHPHFSSFIEDGSWGWCRKTE